MLFWLSLLALALGPLAYPFLRRASRGLALLDGFLLVSVTGLVLLHLFPHSLQVAGGWAALAALAGLLLPLIADRWWRASGKESNKAFSWLAALALGGLLCHALMDGVALATPHVTEHHHEGGLLALAVLFHRLPFGLALAWLLVPRWGNRAAWLVVGLIAAATSVGYVAGQSLFIYLPSQTMALFQALITGSLLHVLFEHRSQNPGAPAPYWSGLGGLLGVGMLVLLAFEHAAPAPQQLSTSLGSAFFELALESAPALLLAYLGAGLMFALLRPAAIGWLQRGSLLSQSARGMMFGLPLPICSCGVVPLYQSLVRAGAPTTAGLAFLIATPELGLDALLLSFPLLGVQMTWLRLVAAVIAAMVVSWVVGRWFDQAKQATKTEISAQAPSVNLSWRKQFVEGLRYGFGENVSHTLPWILAGLFLAAMLQPLVPTSSLAAMPTFFQVPLAALIGMPIYVCASGSTPFVAVLFAKGLSPGAAIAFLLTGPATNITTFGLLRHLHDKRVATAFAVGMVSVSCALGWGIDLLFQVPAPTTLGIHVQQHTTLQFVCLALLALLALFTLVHAGPRFLVGQLVPAYAPDDHEHSHSHSHVHTHVHSHSHGHGHDHGHQQEHTRTETPQDHEPHDHAHHHDHGHEHHEHTHDHHEHKHAHTHDHGHHHDHKRDQHHAHHHDHKHNEA